jgi:two-component system, LuxR family, sensor histidine kinase TtrS
MLSATAKMRRAAAALLIGLGLAGCAAAAAPADDAKQTVRIGILAYAPPWIDGSFVDESVRFLNWKLPQYRFVAKVYQEDELAEAIRRGDADIAAAPASFVRINDTLGLEVLCALSSSASPSPDISSAGAVIVRRGSAHPRTLADLSRTSVSFAGTKSTPGLLDVYAALAEQGIKPAKAFGTPAAHGALRMRRVVEDVLTGRAKAGVVRACFLEDLRATGGRDYFEELEVLSPVTGDGLPCAHSTPAHPGWVVSAAPGRPGGLITDVTATLLAKPVNAWGQKWMIATNFRAVDSMLQTLGMGRWAAMDREIKQSIWKKAQPFALAAAVLLALLILHTVRLRRAVAERTRELESTHKSEQEAQRRAQHTAEHLDRLQRAGVVGQMSSIIAHEMNQPLGTIENLCRGLERSLEDEDPPSNEEIAEAVQAIGRETERAAGIVNRVRRLSRSSEGGKQRLEVAKAVRSAIDQLKSSRRTKAQIIDHLEASAYVEMNPLDLELILLNTLQNAADAAAGSANPTVEIFVTASGGSVAIDVRDNGPALSDEAFAALSQPTLSSSKHAGLGLGLMIVKSLIESAVGRLEFERVKPHGLLARIVLPAAPAEKTGETK